MTLELGKPFPEARGEVVYAAGFIEWSAEEAKRIYGETVQAFVPDKRLLVLRQAIGVTASITPWNFPAAMIARKMGPALAAGCTMIAKPASKTPLTALALGELALEAGIPAGVVQRHPGPGHARWRRRCCPTGACARCPSRAPRRWARSSWSSPRQHVTKLGLELGGHAPFLVFDDANIDLAVAGALGSKFRNAGQTCICANRIYVQSGIHDRFVEALAAKTASLKVGDGFGEGVDIGPLVDDRAVVKVEEHVADAVAKGATVAVGGHRLAAGDGPRGPLLRADRAVAASRPA